MRGEEPVDEDHAGDRRVDARSVDLGRRDPATGRRPRGARTARPSSGPRGVYLQSSSLRVGNPRWVAHSAAARRAWVSHAGTGTAGRELEAGEQFGDRGGRAVSSRGADVSAVTVSPPSDRRCLLRERRRSRAASRSSARSLSPERTIRPSAMTWTRSGTM